MEGRMQFTNENKIDDKLKDYTYACPARVFNGLFFSICGYYCHCIPHLYTALCGATHAARSQAYGRVIRFYAQCVYIGEN